MAVATNWKAQVLARMHERDRVQGRSFQPVIDAHAQLLSANLALRRTIEVLEKENTVLQHTCDEALQAMRRGSDAQTSLALSQAQEKLVAKIEEQNEMRREHMELTRDVRRLEGREKALQERVSVLEEDNARLRSSLAQCERQLAERDASLARMAEALEQTQGLLAQSEQRATQLQAENESMLNRVLDEKERMANEMNTLTDLVERLQRGGGVPAGEAAGAAAAGAADAAAAAGAGETCSEMFASMHGAVASFLPTGARITIRGHTSEVHALVYNQAGTLLASASSDHTVRVWDAKTGHERAKLRAPDAVLCVDMLGGMVAGAGVDRAARVWDMDSQRVRFVYQGHSGKIFGVKFVKGGSRLVTGSADRTLRVWDTSSDGFCVRTISCYSICNSLAATPDGNILASAHQDGKVRVWNPDSGERLHQVDDLHAAPAVSVYFTGGYVPILLTAGKDGVLNVLEARRFVPIAQLSHPDFRVSTGWAGVCLSADSKYAAAGSADGTLLVWQVDTKKVVFKKKEHTSAITCVDWSPLGTQLASCDKSGAIVLWE